MFAFDFDESCSIPFPAFTVGVRSVDDCESSQGFDVEIRAPAVEILLVSGTRFE